MPQMFPLSQVTPSSAVTQKWRILYACCRSNSRKLCQSHIDCQTLKSSGAYSVNLMADLPACCDLMLMHLSINDTFQAINVLWYQSASTNIHIYYILQVD